MMICITSFLKYLLNLCYKNSVHNNNLIFMLIILANKWILNIFYDITGKLRGVM